MPDHRCDAIIRDIFEAIRQSPRIPASSIYVNRTTSILKSVYGELAAKTKEMPSLRGFAIHIVGLYIIQHTVLTDEKTFQETFHKPLLALGKIDNVEAATNSELGEQMHSYCSNFIQELEEYRDVTLAGIISAIGYN